MAGARPVGWRAATGGLTLAQRWVVELQGGTRAFAKVAVNTRTAEWLRAEHRVYSALKADWLPRVVAWSDDGRQPILMLEELSAGAWPPPWTGDMVGQLVATLAEVRRARPAIPLVRLVTQRQGLMRWRQIADDPRSFLSLGLGSVRWLQEAQPRLAEAEAAAELDGDELLHCDLKSGNVCFHAGRCLLIDWNWACRGNGLADLVQWLPSLHDEGGPRPETILPGQGPLAALLAGYRAYHAALPPPPQAPVLREQQLRWVKRALPWACRELGLPGPDLLLK
jgi:hypothetical protein